jgi:hypothetical protein
MGRQKAAKVGGISPTVCLLLPIGVSPKWLEGPKYLAFAAWLSVKISKIKQKPKMTTYSY